MAAKKKTAPPAVAADEVWSQSKYLLSIEEQREIRSRINEFGKDDILAFAQEVLKNPDLSVRDEKFIKFREFYVKLKSGDGSVSNLITPEHVEFIKNNASRFDYSPAAIAKALFPEATGTVISSYSLPIKKTLEGLGLLAIEEVGDYGDDGPLGDYTPPRTQHMVMAKINEAVPTAKYYVSGLDSVQKENVRSMSAYLNHDMFVAKASGLKDKRKRRMFEMEFIRCLYDKPNLGNEYVTSYITLCYEMVNEITLTTQRDRIDDMINAIVVDDDDEEKKKFNLAIGKAYEQICKNLDACKKRIEDLKKSLVGALSEKNKDMIDRSRSFAAFIELVKRKEGRDKLIKIAEAEKEDLKEEVEKISGYDWVIAEAWGLGKNEILDF